MKPSFHARLINGPFDDPGLYVRMLREGRAFMFDLGETSSLTARDILKTSDIFISHTHVDHFIGFDNFLRISLKKERPLRLFGPKGFTECVEGKLRSYTWNLIGDYPLTMEVSEVTVNKIKKSVFSARNSFRRTGEGETSYDGRLLKESSYSISAVILDHQIPCLAFSLEEEYHINIDKARLEKLKLPVGPWLGDLKKAIRENNSDSTFLVNGKSVSFQEVRDIAHLTRGQKIAYVVDAIGSEENIEKVIDLVKGSDVLYIETYFLDQDRQRARDRYHLTAREAGRIARDAQVRRFIPFHFSPRYSEYPKKLIHEAEKEFGKH